MIERSGETEKRNRFLEVSFSYIVLHNWGFI